MALPESFLIELKARNDVESVLSQYVNLKRRGRNLVGLCPFHGEKTPSFTVYPENGSYYCFGCNKGGDVITFVRDIENLDYIEAVRFLASRAGLDLPEDGSSDKTVAMRTRILEMNRQAARFFYKTLYSQAGRQALDYYKSRGLTEQTIKHFGLGFAPNTWDHLLKHLRESGYKPEEIAMADLVIKGRGNSYYDKFRGRVIYPILDLRGGVVGFGGRVLDDSKPKYINTADTLVFKKSRNLFAMNFAKNSKETSVILAEGYMDVIAMHQAGFTNAVAKLGTALAPEQAQLLTRYTEEMIIAGDTDEAGRKAVNRDISVLREAGLKIRLLTLPKGKDPDEYIRDQGAVRFKNLLTQSANDVEYRLSQIGGRFDQNTSDGKVSYLKEAAKLIASLNDALERDVYAGSLAAQLDVTKDTILMQINRERRMKHSAAEKQQFKNIQMQTAGYGDKINPDRQKHARAAAAEERILALLMRNPDFLPNIREKMTHSDFQTAFNGKIFEVISSKIDSGISDIPLLLAGLNEYFSSEEMARIVGISAKAVAGIDPVVELDDCIQTLKNEKIKRSTAEKSTMSVQEAAAYARKITEHKKRGSIQ